MTLEESVTEMVVKARDYPDPWWYLDCLCILTIWKLEGRHLITS